MYFELDNDDMEAWKRRSTLPSLIFTFKYKNLNKNTLQVVIFTGLHAVQFGNIR